MPSSTSAPSRRAASLPADERRAAIVEATKPLLLEFGESVTSRQIAKAAGIAEGTVFRVFADKDAVLAATLESALDLEPFEAAVSEIDPTLPFEERLVLAVEITERRIVEVWQLLSSVSLRLREGATRPLAESAAMTALLESGQDRLRVDPAHAARILRAFTLAVAHPALAVETTSAADIVDLLLRGIGKNT